MHVYTCIYVYQQKSIFFSKQNYGYSVGQLWDLLQEIRVHYNEVLMQHWVQVFRDILDEDSFLPIQVIIIIIGINTEIFFLGLF